MDETKDTDTVATYARLFPEQLAERCGPSALESNSGPVAYLHALYEQAKALEAARASDHPFKLINRRPDIAELVLNAENLEKKIPPLTLVIKALSRQAEAHLGASESINQALSEARLTDQLPFNLPLEQIQAVLKHKKLPLFELLQTLEYSFPGFCFGQLRNEQLRYVMGAATGFSPTLRGLLLESEATASESLLQRFGATGSNALNDLRSVEYFCQKTGLKPEDVFDLLATSGVADNATQGVTAVKISGKYKPQSTTESDGCVYGAAFINNGKAPALSLEDKLAGPGITLAVKNATTAHFVRMHKVIHLRHALKLSFAQTDLVLMSALRAEGQTKDFQITEDTLRTLGVFRYLNESYEVSAEQFAALIYQVSPYAVGDDVPFLDRVLDGPGAGELADIDESLIIDGEEFDPAESSDNSGNSSAHSTIGRLCKALGMDERLTNVHLAQATAALGLTKPTLSIELISSLYRLSRLPRLLRLSVSGGLSLLGVLASSNPEIVTSLAGKPRISSEGDSADILDVLIALVNIETWLRRNKISPQAFLKWITPMTPAPSVSTAVKRTVGELGSRLEGSLLTETKIKLAVGSDALEASAGTWTNILSAYLDANGLIIPEQTSATDFVKTVKELLAGKIANQTLADEVALLLESLIKNAITAQEDIFNQIVKSGVNADDPTRQLLPANMLPLVRWVGKTRVNVLSNTLSALRSDAAASETPRTLLTGLDAEFWEKVARYGQALAGLRISPLGLTALLDHPEWFDLASIDQAQATVDTATPAAPVTPALNVDTCYQLSRYSAWIEQCQGNGFSEMDALEYLADFSTKDTPDAANAAAQHLAKLIGWHASETISALPCVEQILTRNTQETAPKTYDDFLSSLTPSEKRHHDSEGRSILNTIYDYLLLPPGRHYVDPLRQSTYIKLNQFILDNKLPLKVTEGQFKLAHKPDEWKKARKYVTKPMELEVYTPPTKNPFEPVKFESILVPCVPNLISDIDFILRLQSLSRTTGLSCQSLMDFYLLDQDSPYASYETAGRLMLSACSETEVSKIQPLLQEQYRDALTAYLLAYWAPSNPQLSKNISSSDDLSNYFLTDIGVSSQARQTTAVMQTINSLQHYLHRVFSHLDAAFGSSELPKNAIRNWQQYLSRYETWKQWRAQNNHPENLIYYANRPQKSTAFQELEVEVNQGKLDTSLLQTAICNYLTKFERISNLQVVSGYLDGRDPKNDTYYLIGKTNASPAEYYWRSADMSLRDDQERLSPLAWSEWQKIVLPINGQIAQSRYTETLTEGGKTKSIVHTCDAVRMVIIAGRPYVFWVERGTTGLPSADERNQPPTKYRKLSVQYVFLQSDGFWSTANELMCLDGTKDGKRAHAVDANNDYLKDENYVPGLIAFVNKQGPRAADPWLTVILYNCSAPLKTRDNILEDINKQYFIEMRDLLLIDRKYLFETNTEKRTGKLSYLLNTAYASYRDPRNIQHTYDGRELYLRPKKNLSSALTEEGFEVLQPKEDENHFRPSLTVELDREADNTIIIRTISAEEADQEILVNHIKKDSSITKLAVQQKTEKYVGFAKSVFRFNFEDFGQFLVEYDSQGVQSMYLFEISGTATDEAWNISVKTDDQAQYLDLTAVSTSLPKFASDKIRLNTLFGKQLVARATQSVERALGWDTQRLKEPTIDTNDVDPSVDFHGANGLYFRELFLHLPALIATRLTEQQQFEDAEAWYLQYLFDPYRASAAADGRPAYWNARPLAEVGTLKSRLAAPDPVARAFILSSYYRQAVFLSLVENWRLQGDHFYRQLTLSSLNHAWLCYQQALKLIGPLPERIAVSRWTPVPLSAALPSSFLTPINPRVIEARNIIQRRIYNLRHGLTIDGKALPDMSWGDESDAPFDSAKGGLSILAGSYNGDRTAIPAYRFRQLLPAARAAVQQLLDFGRHYMKLMEDEFNTTLSVLLKAQEVKISDFTLRLKKEEINSVIAKKRTLETARSAALYRHAFYSDLIQTGRNAREEAATALTWSAGYLNVVSAPFTVAEGSLQAVPRIFGMAIGGQDMSGPVGAAKEIVQGAASFMKFTAEQLLLESSYERRSHQWEFDRREAQFDIEKLKLELSELNVELNAATISLEESRQDRLNLEEAYVAMTTGFTIIPIYNWLVARQELIYGAAYDAVLSLCLSLEAAWRYETGDYGREAFIKTSAWSDSYKGMLAGESLLVDLLEMENAYLMANERRLTIKKTFSLKALMSDAAWASGIELFSKTKPFLFELKADDFDKQYPGHYMRQLKHVSVSFVFNAGSTVDELSAILTQTGNTLLVSATEDGAQYFYKKSQKPSQSIKRNLRAQQQIALSSTVSEDGLGFSPGEWVYELMFHDGRYLPFEGTGAISQWQLVIPDVDLAQKMTIAVVKDIQINLVYTALSGDSEFTATVMGLRAAH